MLPPRMRPPRPVPSVGARVGVFAPSSPVPPDRYQAGKDALLALGFQVVEPPAVRATHGYLAGTDEARLSAFHALLDDPSIDVLWAARGGYGLHRIAADLDPQRIAKAQKAIVGFSDVTVIHSIAQAKADLITIHGPVVTQVPEVSADDRERLVRLLTGHLDLEIAAEGPVIAPGVAEGILLGGCLSVLAPLVGSQLLPKLDGAILLLEDVGEATYRIDRLLTHLLLAGILGKVAGIALGDFVGCNPRKDGEQTIQEVLHERLSRLGVPVLAGLPLGHGRRNAALPLGSRARLDADAQRLVCFGA